MTVLSSRYTYEGTETTETSITRTGSAPDPTGSPQSRKIITTANSQWLRPFKAEPYVAWNGVTDTTVMATVYGVVNSGVLPNNDDIWMDVEHLKASSGVLGTIVTTTKSNLLASSAAVTSDSSTWSTSTTVTWDASTAALVLLSSNNLVVTVTSTSSSGVRAADVTGQTTGKYYFEVTLTAMLGGGSNGTGVGTTTSTYAAMGSNATTGALVFFLTGVAYTGGTSIGAIIGARATGDVIGIAVDLDNRKIWFRVSPSGLWDNNAAHNPATNVGGYTIPAGTMVPFITGGGAGSVGDVFTANFGASSFTGAVPSGFGNWPNPWSPFKLTRTLDLNVSGSDHAPVGYIEARVRAAKASTTYYIDPTIELSPSGATAGAVTAYKTSRYVYEGTETTETSIVRVNGAVDPVGQVQSRKIVTTANSQWLRPFKAEPYAQWNDITGSNRAVTIYGTVNSGALPLNDEIWMDVEYLTLSSQLNPTQFDGIATGVAVLSNGNLTVTRTSIASGMASSTTFLSTGKYYFEITVTQKSSSATYGIGIFLPNATFTNADAGTNCFEVSISSVTAIYANNVSSGVAFGTANSGDVYSFAIDLTNRLGWVRKNGGNWNMNASYNPATGVGGVAFAAGGFAPGIGWTTTSLGTGDNLTANFGATAFTYTAPSGFGNWISAPAPLGKIVTTTKANVLATGTSVASDSSTWSNTTWTSFDGANSSQVTVTNNGLTATLNTATSNVGARSMSSQTTGKFYVEFTAGQMSNACICGILNSAATYANMQGASNTTLVTRGGSIISNNSGAQGASLGTFNLGDVACFAIDLTARLAWVRRNAGNWNGSVGPNPATGTSGIPISPTIDFSPAVSWGGGSQTVGDAWTANFGAAAFAQTVPSGFTAGWSASFTPFKLTTTLSSPQPGVAGYIHVRPRVAKASSTFYLDPQITLS